MNLTKAYKYMCLEYAFKDVHRRQKLTTDFFRLFELTIFVVTISI